MHEYSGPEITISGSDHDSEILDILFGGMLSVRVSMKVGTVILFMSAQAFALFRTPPRVLSPMLRCHSFIDLRSDHDGCDVRGMRYIYTEKHVAIDGGSTAPKESRQTTVTNCIGGFIHRYQTVNAGW